MKKYLPIYILLILAVSTRFLPHPANFTAVGTIAMFGGLYLPRRFALIGPLIVMFVSDIFLGFYQPVIMAVVYASFVVMTSIGIWVRQNKKITTVLGGTILGSIIFYLLTNFAVWVFGTMYAHTWTGLMQCYYTALPFFKNTIAGDLTYVAALVGGYELITNSYKTKLLHNKV